MRENRIGSDLHVILLQNWSARDWLMLPGLPWGRSLAEFAFYSARMILYPFGDLASWRRIVGRGTERHSNASAARGFMAPNSPNT